MFERGLCFRGILPSYLPRLSFRNHSLTSMKITPVHIVARRLRLQWGSGRATAGWSACREGHPAPRTRFRGMAPEVSARPTGIATNTWPC